MRIALSQVLLEFFFVLVAVPVMGMIINSEASVPDRRRASVDERPVMGVRRPGWVEIDRELLAARACRSLSTVPRPFLRWAGSKRRLLPGLVEVLPPRFRVYYEPFLGGASLFFLLRPAEARLSDSCLDLVRTYEAVRDNPAAVLRFLSTLAVDRETYYAIRGDLSKGRFKRAAQFIYLNKVGWNGLYRVNSRGEFNVPFGAPRTSNLIDSENLHGCAESLGAPGVKVGCGDFGDALAGVEEGDLVYLDPPYVTRHNNNGFVDYNERLFSWADQERLAAEAVRLSKLGATVLVSNAHHDEVLSLFPGFDRIEVGRASTIASSSGARGRVSEAILIGQSAEARPLEVTNTRQGSSTRDEGAKSRK